MVRGGGRLLARLLLAVVILSGVMAGPLMADMSPVMGLFLGYSKAINTVALSPNGRQALTGGQDNVLRLWDIPAGLLLRTLDAQANRITAAAFTPDGQSILAAGDRHIRIWAVSSGQLLTAIEAHDGDVLSLAVSPDGRQALSGGADTKVKLWDVETGGLLRTFEGHSGEVFSIAFSADGTKALSASSDKTLKLWDAETGELLKTLEGHADAVTAAAFLADGAKAVSASRDKTIKLWDLASGQLLRTFEGHADEVLSVAPSSDGSRLLSASKDKTLRLWDAKTGELLKTLEGHSDAVTSVAVSPDGDKAVSGGADKTLKLWDLQTAGAKETINVESPAFWPNGYRDFFSGVGLNKKADAAEVDARLREKGLHRGAPVFLRIFKGDREAELWMMRGRRYELFATYPICAWSGQLGPKEREGDMQAPEGFYAIGKGQLNPNSRFHRAFNLGYPNDLDRAHNRTGANLMIHGGCGSVGCFAMTDAEIDELWLLVTAALDSGQERVPVHVFPFRMTDERMAAFDWHPYAGFWRDLKPAYDLFEERRIPPRVSVCNKRYQVEGQAHGGWTPVSQSTCSSSRGLPRPLAPFPRDTSRTQ